VSHSSKLLNLGRGLWESPKTLWLVKILVAWPCGWHFKWRLCCGNEPLTCEVWANSRQLASELFWIVGHPAGVQRVGELVGVRKNPTHLVSDVLWIKTDHNDEEEYMTAPNLYPWYHLCNIKESEKHWGDRVWYRRWISSILWLHNLYRVSRSANSLLTWQPVWVILLVFSLSLL